MDRSARPNLDATCAIVALRTFAAMRKDTFRCDSLSTSDESSSGSRNCAPKRKRAGGRSAPAARADDCFDIAISSTLLEQPIRLRSHLTGLQCVSLVDVDLPGCGGELIDQREAWGKDASETSTSATELRLHH